MQNFTNLCFKNNYLLQSSLNKKQNKAIFRIVMMNGNNCTYFYSLETSIKDIDIARDLYDKIDDVILQATKQQNINIQFQGSSSNGGGSITLDIYGSEITTDITYAQKIATILLKQINNQSGFKIGELNRIYEICCTDTGRALTNQQIRNMFVITADTFMTLLKQDNNKNGSNKRYQQSGMFILNDDNHNEQKYKQNDEIQELKQQIKQMNQELKQINKKYQNQLNQEIKKINKKLQNIAMNQKQKQTQKSKPVPDKIDTIIENSINEKLQRFSTSLSVKISQNLQKIIEQYDISNIQQRFAQIQKILKNESQTMEYLKQSRQTTKRHTDDGSIKSKYALNWVARESNHFSRLQFNGNIITAKYQCNVFGSTKIDKSTSFSLTINQMTKYIGIGVASSQYKNLTSIGSQIMKYGSNRIYFDGKNQGEKGNGFNQGDTITVIVNNTEVQWWIAKSEETKQKIKVLSLKANIIGKNWVPFITFYSPGDQVSIIQH